MRVLVVEDDADSRMLLCRLIVRLGHETVDFACGPDALEYLPDDSIAVALLDIMMPEMSGFELLQEIRSLPGMEELPAIMVTARDQDDDILEGYKSGADYYITKPYTAQQLAYGIKIVLEG